MICNPANLAGLTGFPQLLAVAVGRSLPSTLLFGGLLALALLGLFFWQLRRLRRKLDRRLLAMKEELARDFHDELGSKLTVISLYGELARQSLEGAGGEDTARRHIEKVIATSRQLYAAMKDMIRTLGMARTEWGDPWERLDKLGQDLFAGTDIRFQSAIADEARQLSLPAEARRHLRLLIKEAMHNALRHALPGRVELTAKVTDGALYIAVTDDGRGFDTRLNQIPADGGLQNMRLRASRLGGQLSFFSSEGGTRVQLRYPVPERDVPFVD